MWNKATHPSAPQNYDDESELPTNLLIITVPAFVAAAGPRSRWFKLKYNVRLWRAVWGVIQSSFAPSSAEQRWVVINK